MLHHIEIKALVCFKFDHCPVMQLAYSVNEAYLLSLLYMSTIYFTTKFMAICQQEASHTISLLMYIFFIQKIHVAMYMCYTMQNYMACRAIPMIAFLWIQCMFVS